MWLYLLGLRVVLVEKALNPITVVCMDSIEVFNLQEPDIVTCFCASISILQY